MSLAQNFRSLFTPAPHGASADCLAQLRGGKALLIDVREPAEWAGGVAQGAQLLPLSDLTGDRARWQKVLEGAGDRDLVLYCASGMRSGKATRLLTAEGFRATNAGGLSGLAAAGWRIEPPART